MGHVLPLYDCCLITTTGENFASHTKVSVTSYAHARGNGINNETDY